MNTTLRFALALFVLASLPLRAASEYPPSYRWRTIETTHFFIHYHQGEEELARRAAAIAEQVHVRITPLMDYEPSQRTHVILTDHVDVSNGSATPFPFNRIEIYVSAPGADPSSPIEYYDNWLNLVITHEYTHILHLDQARAYSGALRKVFGRTPLAFPNEFSPLWMTEGIATLVESEATDSGRLKGTFVDMVLRTAAIENRWLTQAQAGGLSPTWPGGSARYFYGSKFLGWVAQTQGMDKLADYFHDYAGNFIPYRVNASAEDVFNTSMNDLWRRWSDEQQRAYRDDQTRIAADGATTRERLTQLGYETKYPALSPDGTRIAYTHDGPYEWPTIRVYDLASKRDVEVQRVNSTSPLSWSADGTSLAFAQLDYRGSFALVSDLYVWRVGDGVQRLTSGARLKDPSFTPDGRAIVAVENRAGRNRLVEVDVATRAVRTIVDPGDFTQFSEPSVSHDGSRIAVSEWREGRVDVVVYDRDGKRVANLTEGEARATYASPRFTRDDATLLFSCDATGVPNICEAPSPSPGLRPPSPVVRRVTNVYGGAFFPTSGDGKRIYYIDYSSTGFDLATTDATREFPIVARVIPKTLVTRAAEVKNEPAPVTNAPDEPYRPSRSVWPRWWMPILGEITTTESNGTRVEAGAYTSGGDALGFHTYTAEVLARTGGDGPTQVDYGLVYSYDRWYPTFTVAGFGSSDDTDATVVRDGVRTRYRERTDRALAQITLPYRRVRWQTSATAGIVRDHIDSDMPFDIAPSSLRSIGIFTGTLQGFRAAASFNNATEFGFSISPENGFTALVEAENLSRALGSDASLRQYRGELRGYRAIPFARAPLGRHVIAARIAGGTTSGDFVLQRELKVGGIAEGDFAMLDTTRFAVRGYENGELRGDSAAIASIEYRFPLWQIDRGPGAWPIFFNRLLGDVFYDTGTAWNRRAVTLPALTRARSEAGDRKLSSVGAELGADVTLGFFVPLRYRVGAAWRLENPDKGKVEVYAGVGTSF